MRLAVGVLAACTLLLAPQASATHQVIIERTHDYLGPPETESFEVAPGTVLDGLMIAFNGNWVDLGPQAYSASAGPRARITVFDPSGDAPWTLEHAGICPFVVSGEGPSEWGCGEWISESFEPPLELESGTWTIDFTGLGFTTGAVRLSLREAE